MMIKMNLLFIAVIILFAASACVSQPSCNKPNDNFKNGSGIPQINEAAFRQIENPIVFNYMPASEKPADQKPVLIEPGLESIPLRVYTYRGQAYTLKKDLSKKLLEPVVKISKKKQKSPVKKKITRKAVPKTKISKKNGNNNGTEDLAAKENNPKPETDIRNPDNSAVREVFARPGDAIEINFDKSGWYFTGFLYPAHREGVNFLNREVTNRATNFSFKALKTGEYPLKFSYQDNVSGKRYDENVLLKVVTQDEFDLAVNDPQNMEPAIKEEISTADNLFESGKYSEALDKYLKNYKENSPVLNEKIASAYMKNKDPEKAVDFWKKNMKYKPEYSRNALRHLIDIYLGQSDTENLMKYGLLLLPEKDKVFMDDYLKVSRYLFESNRDGPALDILNGYIQAFPYGESLDQVYYMLGKLYEKDSLYRDFSKSKRFYTLVCDEFPHSSYADESRNRIRYLNRYVFFIR
ncbi:MAG: hypothetical protein JW969_04160 [Spirochaetales bacterium]|nr:hypothetical protein [Spirochaetales bacterium]